MLAPVVIGRRCASLDSAGIFFSGSPAAGWLKLWWNRHLPPIPPLRSSDTACLLADHIRGPRCVRLFTTWPSHDPGGLPVFELPGGLGGLNPLPHPADPPTSGQNSTPGGRVSTPPPKFC